TLVNAVADARIREVTVRGLHVVRVDVAARDGSAHAFVDALVRRIAAEPFRAAETRLPDARVARFEVRIRVVDLSVAVVVDAVADLDAAVRGRALIPAWPEDRVVDPSVFALGGGAVRGRRVAALFARRLVRDARNAGCVGNRALVAANAAVVRV